MIVVKKLLRKYLKICVTHANDNMINGIMNIKQYAMTICWEISSPWDCFDVVAPFVLWIKRDKSVSQINRKSVNMLASRIKTYCNLYMRENYIRKRAKTTINKHMVIMNSNEILDHFINNERVTIWIRFLFIGHCRLKKLFESAQYNLLLNFKKLKAVLIRHFQHFDRDHKALQAVRIF